MGLEVEMVANPTRSQCLLCWALTAAMVLGVVAYATSFLLSDRVNAPLLRGLTVCWFFAVWGTQSVFVRGDKRGYLLYAGAVLALFAVLIGMPYLL